MILNERHWIGTSSGMTRVAFRNFRRSKAAMILCLLPLTFHLGARNSYPDILHLKNGRSLEGEITEEGARIVIQLRQSGAVLGYDRNQIERIERKPAPIADKSPTLVQNRSEIKQSQPPRSTTSEVLAGVGAAEITPALGTPSAGLGAREGRGMTSVHDPLLATALLLSTGDKLIALVSVDLHSVDYAIVREIRRRIREKPGLEDCEIHVGATHTYHGGGGHIRTMGQQTGEALYGKFDQRAFERYVQGTVQAVVQASARLAPVKIGVGYGRAAGLVQADQFADKGLVAPAEVAVIKVTKLDDSPLAAVFNFSAKPFINPDPPPGTRFKYSKPYVLPDTIMEFSAAYVGYARSYIQQELGGDVLPIFFAGADADVIARPPSGSDRYAKCESMGRALAAVVKEVWDRTEAKEGVSIRTLREPYRLQLKPNPRNKRMLPGTTWPTEINLLVIDGVHAFVTIPAEMSASFDPDYRRFGREIGFANVSIFACTNDFHLIIVTREAWRKKTFRANTTAGGKDYGEIVRNKVYRMLQSMRPGAVSSQSPQSPTRVPGLRLPD